MAKTNPELFPELVGDAAMIPYFDRLSNLCVGSENIPAVSAVYFVYVPPDIVLYIGQATSLATRWKSHRFLRLSCYEIKNLRLAWLPAEPATLTVIERYYIQKLRPPLNKNYARGNRSCVNPVAFVNQRNILLSQV